MTNFERETRIIGKHEFWFFSPNRLHGILRGAVEVDDIRATAEYSIECAQRAGEMLHYSVDITGLERISEAARKFAIEYDQPYAYDAIAFIGTGFSVRTLIRMVVKAGTIVSPKNFAFSYKFVDSFDDANTWFAELKSEG